MLNQPPEPFGAAVRLCSIRVHSRPPFAPFRGYYGFPAFTNHLLPLPFAPLRLCVRFPGFGLARRPPVQSGAAFRCDSASSADSIYHFLRSPIRSAGIKGRSGCVFEL
jgi:hypothetical protein